MTADILTDGDHPHGTIEGFQRGCKSGACPAPVSCSTVRLRYNGDFAFRRAIDAGKTPAEALALGRPVAAPRVLGKKTRGRQYERRAPGVANTPNQQAVKTLHEQGLTDRQIAEQLGKTPGQVAATRNHMKLPANSKAPATSGASS